MKAAVLYGKEDIRLESVPLPALGPGEILVRVRTALTCGTDVKVFRRGYHARMIIPPALFGHELAGDVADVGPGVNRFRVGQRVVAANSAPCGECFFCRRNQANLCEDLLFNNGAYAEFIRIPARIVEKNTYEIPHHLRYQDAALIEPLACVLKGLDESHIQPGDTVAVMGLGPIGLMFVRMAKAVCGARVIAVARRQLQIDNAVRLGADDGVILDLDQPERTLTQVKYLTSGRGADVVIEAVGQTVSWELATQMVRKGGIVNFFGGCANGAKVGLDTQLLHYSEITCKASFHHTPGHIRRSLEIVASGRVTANHLVNREEPLDNLLKVMYDLMSRNGHIKTAIIP
ncbi:MAG TPA: alcohol dehydrogenase catalytic domain-containing protein [Bryobacteraceae bacterium]|nr:alcohol dehydrogenase catalytic domain-containing protein [Bryobacteraceae bacterium]